MTQSGIANRVRSIMSKGMDRLFGTDDAVYESPSGGSILPVQRPPSEELPDEEDQEAYYRMLQEMAEPEELAAVEIEGYQASPGGPEEEQPQPQPTGPRLPVQPRYVAGGVLVPQEIGVPWFYADYLNESVRSRSMNAIADNTERFITPTDLQRLFLHPEEPRLRETGCVQVEELRGAEAAALTPSPQESIDNAWELAASDDATAAARALTRKRFAVRAISWRHRQTEASSPRTLTEQLQPEDPEERSTHVARIRLGDLLACLHKSGHQDEFVRAFEVARHVPATHAACYELLDRGEHCRALPLKYDDGSVAWGVDPVYYASRFVPSVNLQQEGWLYDCCAALASTENVPLEMRLGVEGGTWTTFEHPGITVRPWWQDSSVAPLPQSAAGADLVSTSSEPHAPGAASEEQSQVLNHLQTHMRSLLLKNMSQSMLPRTKIWGMWLAGRGTDYLKRLVVPAVEGAPFVLLRRTFSLTVLLSHFANPLMLASFRTLRYEVIRALEERTEEHVRLPTKVWQEILQQSEPLMRSYLLENVSLYVRRWDGRPFAGKDVEFSLLMRVYFRDLTGQHPESLMLPDELERT